MDVIVYTCNSYLISLFKSVIKNDEIKVIGTDNRDLIVEKVKKKENLAVILDFPHPNQEDFEFWMNILKITSIPIFVLNSNENDIEKVLLRERAVIQLVSPLTDIFQSLQLDRVNQKLPDIIYITDDVFFDLAGHCIRKRNECYHLSSTEFKILYILSINVGSALTANQLIDFVDLSGLSTLYVHIQKLREKIEEDPRNPRILTNKRGEGYKLNVAIKQK
ncbi:MULTISPECIES: winged helix-turn-helix domain-containing protein [Bacillus]|uniref:Winged helix-turn-helix domain-containing protein n=1 Tax=Bacillus rugosus TaxID=2715209 RepID=A0ACD3ZYA9_9BACI|nr:MULTISPECIES: winged helix-turn-helix domain-containing protein [Bacillus]MBY4602892.1 winged helix-turn-helix domain-containing protein [Bacillus sp. SPARC3]UPV78980.1 winged helix-turn-helix domain-containing protein [Bacillus rugosus]